MTSIAKRWRIHWTAAALILAQGVNAEIRADDVVYATADNGTTNLFGTMDLTTGQFTQVTTTTPLFGSLTAGAGGTIYGGAATPYGAANPDLNLYSISPSGSPTQFGTVSAPNDPAGIFNGFLGLAAEGASGFYADYVSGNNPAPLTATLAHISADGTSVTVVGTMGGFGSYNSGALAFGPNGNLYFNAWTTSDVATLYLVNTTTGAATAVGTGLGAADALALVTVGSTLYGIDTFAPTDPTIYTINTTTGTATAIGDVSGLPTGYTLDTMASTVPEPTTFTMLGTGTLFALALCKYIRRRPQC